MKTDYESRARKFAHVLIALFAGCESLDDFEFAISEYNATHSRPLVYAHGVSRIAIIRSDYVIKFDFCPSGWWEDGRAGSISSEAHVYEQQLRMAWNIFLLKLLLIRKMTVPLPSCPVFGTLVTNAAIGVTTAPMQKANGSKTI